MMPQAGGAYSSSHATTSTAQSGGTAPPLRTPQSQPHNQTGRPSFGTSSPRKRKLTLSEVAQLRRKVSENEGLRIVKTASRYAERCAVRCYLGGGGSPAEYPTWRNRLPPVPLISYLVASRLDAENPSEDLFSLLRSNTSALVRSSSSSSSVAVSSQDAASGPSRSEAHSSRVPVTSPPRPSSSCGSVPSSSSSHDRLSNVKSPSRLPVSPYKNLSIKHEAGGEVSQSSSNQEHIVERARQEAYVVQRIAELQRDGLWSEKRMPKLQELPRPKCHWDYVLEEMVWMAADFAQERMWKKSAAKQCARMVQKYFRRREENAVREVKSEECEQRRIAGIMSREIKLFWSDVEKLNDYRQRTMKYERNKRALSDHLRFIRKPCDNIATDTGRPATESENNRNYEVETLRKESLVPLEDLLGGYFDVRDTLPTSPSEGTEHSVEETAVNLEQPSEDEEQTIDSKAVQSVEEEEEEGEDSAEECGESYEDSSEADEPMDVDLDSSVRGKFESLENVLKLSESAIPDGETLSSAGITTRIPPLLRRKLREYQHVGFDWLVKLSDKKLNGILGDEAGLGKTVQTIALLAHLACEKGDWGPHLIIVPTTEVLLWEMEMKKWCPGLKVLAYYGSAAERKSKRTGWTRPNAFHICITSYKIIVEDHFSFRRKKWRYLVLDEAQYLRNFSSPRWQLLTNLRVQRKLLLIGKALEGEQLKSFTEFILPEGCLSDLKDSSDYNGILKPLSLSRTKNQMEMQLPRQRENKIKCHLSHRQRYLYDDYMKRDETVGRLQSGSLVNILKVLIHLKRLCNHPDLIELRDVVCPLRMEGVVLSVPSSIKSLLDKDRVNLSNWNFLLINLESSLSAFVAHRARLYKTERSVIEEIDSSPDIAQCPRKLGGIKISVQKKSPSWTPQKTVRSTVVQLGNKSSTKIGTSPLVKAAVVQHNATATQGVTLRLANPIGQLQNYLQIVGQPGKVTQTARLAHIVNTPAGKQILISPHQLLSSQPSTVVTSSGQRLTVISKQGVSQTSLRPLLRIPPLAVASNSNILIGTANLGDVTKTDPPTEDSAKQHQENGNKKDAVNQVKDNQSSQEKETTAERKEKLNLIYRMNNVRCSKLPVYGSDVIGVLTLDSKFKQTDWSWTGSVLCEQSKSMDHRTIKSDSLSDMILSYEERLCRSYGETSSFVTYVPKVVVDNVEPDKLKEGEDNTLKPVEDLLYPMTRPVRVQLPERKYVEYDCGKLKALSCLLKRLKNHRRKVVIFTQMNRMLDILESFLNYKSYSYLRVDGSLRLDSRQLRIERFNNDRSIFCCLLSTRSSGVGLHLTGADCVVFYDNDWNPAMETQVQGYCKRIALTRNIDVYRLMSDSTAEENYTSCYIERRLLSDISKQGDDVSQCYVKTSTIQDLFNVDMSELGRQISRPALVSQTSSGSSEDTMPDERERNQHTVSTLESALAQVEDEIDVESTRLCKAEKQARLCEFDEDSTTMYSDDGDCVSSLDSETSKAVLELEALVQELTGVEQYAMKFVSSTDSDSLSLAESYWEQVKKGWEMNRYEADRADRKRKRGDSSSDGEELTYSAVDSRCSDWVTKFGLSMPLWAPPTPPQDDNDMYIDEALCLLYEPTLIPESQLPPAYTKKDRKRSRMEMNLINNRLQSNKMRQKEETLVHAPRSLFDRPTPALMKMRQELRLQRYRGLMRPSVQSLLKPPLTVKPLPEPDHVPDWLIHEDWSILQTLQHVQEMTVNLVVLSPGHTPNWDLVADMVNTSSRTYRSAKQCRNRYESVIIPREEGKPVPDSPKKLKKTKILYKPPQVKTGRPLRTSQLFQQDNNSSMTQVMNCRFDAIRSVSNRRAPTVKPLLVDPTMKNKRHADALARYQINYDQPLNPVEVAARRADRIAKEKIINSLPVQVTDQAQLAVLRQQQLQKLTVAGAGSSTTAAPRQLATLTVQEMVATVGGNRTVVSTSGIPVTRTGDVKSSGSTASSPSGASSSSPTSPSTSAVTSPAAVAKTATKTISATQLALYRQQQQAMLRQQQLKLLKTQQAAAVVASGGTPPKVSIAVTPPQSPAGTMTVPRMQQVVVKSGRPVSESEMVALLKRQQVAKVASGGQAQTPATLTTAQILTSIQVKQLSLQQQLLAAAAAAHQRAGTKLNQQKVAQFSQVTTKATAGTQLIVQSGHKAIPTTVTVQHLQQVMKQVRPGHVVVAGPGRGTIPGTVSLEGRQVLAGALKTSQQAILTQVSTVLPSTSRGQSPLVSAPLITIPPPAPTSQSANQTPPSSDTQPH